MSGATADIAWLEDCVVVDDRAFIETTPHSSPDGVQAARRPVLRHPPCRQDTRPGVFAVDVRSGTVRTAASPGGRGADCALLVHESLPP
jgi:hypothetical protein